MFVDDNPQAPELDGHCILSYAQWLREPAPSRHIGLVIDYAAILEKLTARCVVDGVAYFAKPFLKG